MNRRLTACSLALAGVVLAVGWNMPGSSEDRSDTAPTSASSPSGAFHSRISPASGHGAPPFARTSFDSQSPFAVLPPGSEPPNRSATHTAHPRTQFEQLLRDYRLAEISPEEKLQIKQTLNDLKNDPLARSFMVETFFAADKPQLAESLYGLIRDADLKDVALLEGLIQRDSTRPTAASTARIVDLVADLSTQKDLPYSATIDRYLAQLSLHADAQVRNTAVSQRIWYLAQHQPNNLAALEPYLADSAPTVREEMYSFIESRMANQAPLAQTAFVPALKMALQADHPGASAEEKARVSALLQSLAASDAPL